MRWFWRRDSDTQTVDEQEDTERLLRETDHRSDHVIERIKRVESNLSWLRQRLEQSMETSLDVLDQRLDAVDHDPDHNGEDG